MDERTILCAGFKPAAKHLYTALLSSGFPVTTQASKSVRHVILDVPSFNQNGQLHSGASMEAILEQVAPDACIYGGNLNHSALQNYNTVDFLQDPWYLAENAYITAECALDVALPYVPVTLRDCPILIIGWGRIGKSLGQLLQKIGACVTIAARKETDRAMIAALGMGAVDPQQITDILCNYRMIINTVPALVLNRSQMTNCRTDCIKIDLASKTGIEDDDVIIARGLPGIHMPESSGNLIAKTFLKYYH